MFRRVFPVLIACVLLSCRDSSGPNDLLGTWHLVTVGGQPLPYVLEQNGTTKVELTGETVTVLASGRHTMVTSFRVTQAGVISVESIPASGNYTVTGATVVFTFDSDPEVDTAIVSGDTMTMDDYVYRRE